MSTKARYPQHKLATKLDIVAFAESLKSKAMPSVLVAGWLITKATGSIARRGAAAGLVSATVDGAKARLERTVAARRTM